MPLRTANPSWEDYGDCTDWQPCRNPECRDGIVPKLRVGKHTTPAFAEIGVMLDGPYYAATDCPDCDGTGRRPYRLTR